MKKISIFVFAILIISIISGASAFIINENFKAPQEKSIEFEKTSYIFTGDTGTGSIEQFETAKGIETYCSKNNCTLGIISGDVFYNHDIASVDDPYFFTNFEKPYQNLPFPFLIAFGNHDYTGCKECYIDYSSKSQKWIMPSRYYTYSIPQIELFIIDTENFDLDQQQWLLNSMDKSTATKKVVVGHRPIVTYESGHYFDNWEQKEALKKIICNKADIYFSGHSHILEDNGIIDGCTFRQVVSGAGGAGIRKILPDNKSLFYYEGHGFVSMTKESENNIRIEFVNKNGEIIYEIQM